MEKVEDVFYYSEESKSGLKWARDSYSGNGKLQTTNGADAGSLNNSGQYEVWFNDRLHQVHRLVYILHHSVLAEDALIDHINGNRSDNRIENLRVVDYMINSRNRKMSCKNTTGHTGVYPIHSKKGVLTGYAASWQLLQGYKRDTKRFSFKDCEDPLGAAIWWRGMMIDFLNADGAGYTKDHGKRT